MCILEYAYIKVAHGAGILGNLDEQLAGQVLTILPLATLAIHVNCENHMLQVPISSTGVQPGS